MAPFSALSPAASPSSPHPAPLLALHSVTFSRPDRAAPARKNAAAAPSPPPLLQDISLALWPGERLAIDGANGAGKSTLLQLMVGLLPARSGHVEAFGQPCRTEADFQAIRPRVGLVFQDPEDQLFCPTVEDDLAFGPRNMGLDAASARRQAAWALELVGLPAGFGQRITHHLSGGEKRLVSLAAVLAMQPEVLLLDEPTNALDRQTRQRLLSLVQELPQAIILVSHDEDFASRVSTRRLTLEQGQLLPAPRPAVTGGQEDGQQP